MESMAQGISKETKVSWTEKLIGSSHTKFINHVMENI